MEFRYRYQVKASDLWQVQMYYTYSSYVGLINVICMISSVALLFALWATSPDWFRACLLVFLSLFTVIQPFGTWVRAKNSLKGQEHELELVFHEKDFQIIMGNKRETKTWQQVRAIVIKPTVVVIYMSGSQGYILSNRVLQGSRKEFIRFLKSRERTGAK